ncbi:MAG: hypothetical protein OXT67_05190 [Zetaproteobacteria bacterium]|nr:hypothetical protein [Zetaproteobacteria bacterium]
MVASSKHRQAIFTASPIFTYASEQGHPFLSRRDRALWRYLLSCLQDLEGGLWVDVATGVYISPWTHYLRSAVNVDRFEVWGPVFLRQCRSADEIVQKLAEYLLPSVAGQSPAQALQSSLASFRQEQLKLILIFSLEDALAYPALESALALLVAELYKARILLSWVIVSRRKPQEVSQKFDKTLPGRLESSFEFSIQPWSLSCYQEFVWWSWSKSGQKGPIPFSEEAVRTLYRMGASVQSRLVQLAQFCYLHCERDERSTISASQIVKTLELGM